MFLVTFPTEVVNIPATRDGDPDFETYLHRIGRNGCFGKKRAAISLIDDTRSVEGLDAIESHFAKDPESLVDAIESEIEIETIINDGRLQYNTQSTV